MQSCILASLGDLSGFIAGQSAGSGQVNAYINWIMFDEQFKIVSANTNGWNVGAAESINSLPPTTVNVTKNGYLYVYCSNTSNQDVFFDNLQVIHNRGPLTEEEHYYPFGLTMKGISSQAAGSLENKYKFNKGSELQHQEFADGSGLEWYDTHYRQLDVQLGRWNQPDFVKPNMAESPYAAMGDNPILHNDPLGDTLPPPPKPNSFMKPGSYLPFLTNSGNSSSNKSSSTSQNAKTTKSSSSSTNDGNTASTQTTTSNTQTAQGTSQVNKVVAGVQTGTDIQATTWSSIAKFGSKELGKFGNYATGTGAVVATGNLAIKLANKNADWKDYTGAMIAYVNVGLMKLDQSTPPNPVTYTATVVAGVASVLFDIYTTATAK